RLGSLVLDLDGVEEAPFALLRARVLRRITRLDLNPDTASDRFGRRHAADYLTSYLETQRVARRKALERAPQQLFAVAAERRGEARGAAGEGVGGEGFGDAGGQHELGGEALLGADAGARGGEPAVDRDLGRGGVGRGIDRHERAALGGLGRARQ